MKIFMTYGRTASTENVELIEEVPYAQKIHWFPETFHNTHTGFVFPPHRMAEKVLDPAMVEQIRQTTKGKSAFILAGGNSNFAGVGRQPKKPTKLTFEYKILSLSLTQVFAGRLAAQFGASDLVITDASACASSLKVLVDVQNLIRHYGFSRVVVLSVEDSINDLTLQFFGETGACLTHEKQTTENIQPSAFDSVNEGFYIGQGSVMAVFEAENAMTAEPMMEFKGAWTAGENSLNAVGQREDGEGYRNAIQGALLSSNVSPEEVKIIKTHGTGTKSNNKAEKSAILSVFNDFVATSYKQKIGHTLGASGLLETILLSKDLKSGQVPAIKNRTEEDLVFLSKPVDRPDGLSLCLSAGMGNVYAAAIFDMRN